MNKQEDYTKEYPKGIRSSECYICGKEIPAGETYLYEYRHGGVYSVDSRKSHMECNKDAT